MTNSLGHLGPDGKIGQEGDCRGWPVNSHHKGPWGAPGGVGQQDAEGSGMPGRFCILEIPLAVVRGKRGRGTGSPGERPWWVTREEGSGQDGQRWDLTGPWGQRGWGGWSDCFGVGCLKEGILPVQVGGGGQALRRQGWVQAAECRQCVGGRESCSGLL